jgi:hypothetical protein
MKIGMPMFPQGSWVAYCYFLKVLLPTALFHRRVLKDFAPTGFYAVQMLITGFLGRQRSISQLQWLLPLTRDSR